MRLVLLALLLALWGLMGVSAEAEIYYGQTVHITLRAIRSVEAGPMSHIQDSSPAIAFTGSGTIKLQGPDTFQTQKDRNIQIGLDTNSNGTILAGCLDLARTVLAENTREGRAKLTLIITGVADGYIKDDSTSDGNSTASFNTYPALCHLTRERIR